MHGRKEAIWQGSKKDKNHTWPSEVANPINPSCAGCQLTAVTWRWSVVRQNVSRVGEVSVRPGQDMVDSLCVCEVRRLSIPRPSGGPQHAESQSHAPVAVNVTGIAVACGLSHGGHTHTHTIAWMPFHSSRQSVSGAAAFWRPPALRPAARHIGNLIEEWHAEENERSRKNGGHHILMGSEAKRAVQNQTTRLSTGEKRSHCTYVCKSRAQRLQKIDRCNTTKNWLPYQARSLQENETCLQIGRERMQTERERLPTWHGKGRPDTDGVVPHTDGHLGGGQLRDRDPVHVPAETRHGVRALLRDCVPDADLCKDT